MKAVPAARYLASIFLVAAFAFVSPTSPAVAQKPGGSITVGLEFEIPGFDPLKVGVFDTSTEIAAAAIFDTLTYLDDKREAQPKLALSWTHSEGGLSTGCIVRNFMSWNGLQALPRRV